MSPILQICPSGQAMRHVGVFGSWVMAAAEERPTKETMVKSLKAIIVLLYQCLNPERKKKVITGVEFGEAGSGVVDLEMAVVRTG